MIKIALCDDQLYELEKSQCLLKAYMVENPQYDIKLTTFSAPLELLSYVEEHGGFDLFLLDVYMAGMLGTEAALQLRKLNEPGEIIFLTTSKEHAIDAFVVNAAQYLIKPIKQIAFYEALDKVFKRLNIEKRNIVTLKTTKGIVRLYTRNVVFSETGRNNYQIIHTIDNDQHEVRISSSELFELFLPTKSFVRCGASLNVNLKFIRQIKKDVIIFDSGKQLTYPYRAYQSLKKAFLSYQMDLEE